MKQVQKTAEIIERLQAAFGADVDANGYAVFEATAINNMPIRQKHPLFEGAVAQMSLRHELVSSIKEESVPFQLMHQRGELPAGRVFDAKMSGEDVRILIAINSSPEANNAKLIADMDAAIIDQVSVNLLAKQLLCSQSGCGFDYLGDEADYMNVLNGECGNGHKLREDGTHIQLHGLDHVMEISAVNTGGASGARIHGRDKQAFAAESFQRLAASGLAPAMLVASLTAGDPASQGKPNMADVDINALIASSATDKASITTLTAERDAHAATITTLTAERDAAVTARTEAETERDAAVSTAAPSTAVLEFIKDACTKALIAKGDQTPTVPEKVEDQIAAITAAGVMLSMIPAGGAGQNKLNDVDDGKHAPAASSAYRRAK